VASLSVLCVPLCAIHELTIRVKNRGEKSVSDVIRRSVQPMTRRFYGVVAKQNMDSHKNSQLKLNLSLTPQSNRNDPVFA